MLSLITASPVITAFHSCCLSHHVFDQVNLWPAWVGIETAIIWQCSPGTVETQRLYPLRHRLRRAIKVGFFCSYKSNYLFSLSGPYRICTDPTIEGSNYWGYRYKTQHSYPRSRLITWRRPEVKFDRNIVWRNNKNHNSLILFSCKLFYILIG